MPKQKLISLTSTIALIVAASASNSEEAKPSPSASGAVTVSQDTSDQEFFQMVIDCNALSSVTGRLDCLKTLAEGAEKLSQSEKGEAGDADTESADEAQTEQPSAEPAVEPEKVSASKWIVRSETSPIDDKTNVYLSLASDEHIRARFGQSGPMYMFIQCRENTTLFYLHFNGHFMSDYQNGTVTYRLDKEDAAKKRMRESNDHEALGLWSGSRSIPFVKSMFGHEKMLVRATPHSESAVTATFSIGGLEEAIEPLRDACNW